MTYAPRSHARRRYLMGYFWALGLTLAAFGAVVLGGSNRALAVAVVVAAGLVQIAVHLLYFLHLGFGKSQRENLWLVLFAALLMSLMVGGSLWIMSDLHQRMM